MENRYKGWDIRITVTQPGTIDDADDDEHIWIRGCLEGSED